MRLLAIALVWWLMSGWAFSPDSRVIGGPFDSFANARNEHSGGVAVWPE